MRTDPLAALAPRPRRLRHGLVVLGAALVLACSSAAPADVTQGPGTDATGTPLPSGELLLPTDGGYVSATNGALGGAAGPTDPAGTSSVPGQSPDGSMPPYGSTPTPPGTTPPPAPVSLATLRQEAQQNIKHVVIIMQENRSFDQYFGVFPGADGIPMNAQGVPTVCVPDPIDHRCLKPYHDKGFVDGSGPHHAQDFIADYNHGKMNGFVKETFRSWHFNCRPNVKSPYCEPGTSVQDVMGYKTDAEIPNYWAYAKNFVLQDHLFESVASWSLPSHLYLVSAWSAKCSQRGNPMSCTSALFSPPKPDRAGATHYDWTDITYLLDRAHIRWHYYVSDGSAPDCPGENFHCNDLLPQNPSTPGIWNPLPWFTDVQKDKQIDNVTAMSNFYAAAKKGKLPSVSWVIPNGHNSEHAPNARIDNGQAFVTQVVNTVMKSPDWDSTAIFLSWDDWGGFYDNMKPPTVDNMGYGFRVPGLIISPWVKSGTIDHQVLSYDAYLKFIEDVFLNSSRLNPKTDGRPDSRPDVRENVKILGNLLTDFDFTQTPLPKLILPRYPSRVNKAY